MARHRTFAGPARARCPRALLLGLLFAALLVAAPLTAGSPAVGHAQDGPSLGVDADATGNEPDQLATIESCVSVAPGEAFTVDVIVEEVEELLAWELYLAYDEEVVEITSFTVDMFLGANPGSSVYDVSETLPDADGVFRLGAADTADPPSPDSGSGVLARVQMEALAPGESPLSLAKLDINGDREPDRGPFLRNVAAEIIGDSDDDTLFDGPSEDAMVAVDAPCPPGSSDSTAGPASQSEGDGGVSAYVWAAAGAAALAAAAGVTVLLYRRRLRAQAE